VRLCLKIALLAGAVGVTVGVSVWGLDKLDIIDRFAFEWGDFATLTTGLLAVIGAVWVGMRQVEITDRQANISEQQTKILDRQITLQSLSFKVDLHDRRLKIYSDVKSYAHSIWSREDFNELKRSGNIIVSLEASKFLFNDAIHAKIREIFVIGTKFRAVTEKLDAIERSGGIQPDNLKNEQYELSDKIDAHFSAFTEMSTPYLRVDENIG